MTDTEPTYVVPTPPAVPHPLAIIQGAIDKGISAEELGKLLDFSERYHAEEARKAYSVAMCECQEAMPVVVVDAENEQTNSWYAKLESVIKIIKPVYTAHGFSLSYGELFDGVKDGYCRVFCDVRHKAGHTKQHVVELGIDTAGIKGTANKTAVHGKGSTLSYARRYLPLLVFNVAIAGEDNDGNGQIERISAQQVGEINAGLAQCREVSSQAGHEAYFKKFLEWLQVSSITEIPAADFQKAVQDIQRRIEKGKVAAK